MKQWAFYYDQSRCIACKACVVACKGWNTELRGDKNNEYNINTDYAKSGKADIPSYEENRKYYMKENWRRVSTVEYGDSAPKIDILNQSLSCNHCDKPACLDVCPVGAITKDSETGIVSGDVTKCISCESCKEACPWGAPQFYDEPSRYEENDKKMPKMTKCILCKDRISDGLKPACVAACVNRALDADELSKLKARHSGAQFRKMSGFDESTTGPNIFFKAKKCKVNIG